MQEAVSLPRDLSEAHQLITELKASLSHKDQLIAQLLHQLKQLQRHRFGARSERFNALQAELFSALEALGVEDVSARLEVPAAEVAQEKRQPVRKPLPERLPRKRVEYRLHEAACACELCGHALEKIGEEVSEQLEYVPASVFVLSHVRFKYACKHCQGQVVTAPKPAQPIEKGLAGPGLLAHVLTSKYCDHIPLHRQRGMLRRHGVELPQTTLVDWVRQCAEALVPLVEALRAEVLKSPKIHTDDTPVPVLERGRRKTRQGRLWVYVGSGEHPCTVYDYTPSRARDGPMAFLTGYRGYLQADAYAGYDELYASGEVSEVACWAHARRKFFDAQSSDDVHAQAALEFIGALYGIEREGQDLKPEGLACLRQQKAVPILTAFRAWLNNTARVVLPKSPMGQAIQYALNQWTALNRYPQDGRLTIDNNVAERAIRPLVVGRKNWVFAGSDAGGERAAVIYSLIETCKQHHLDPFVYLADVLKRLPTTLYRELDTLLPWHWAPQAT
jgi:transposase